jgi:hypothetical protein
MNKKTTGCWELYGQSCSPDKIDLNSKSKNELYEEAKNLHIEGRKKQNVQKKN